MLKNNQTVRFAALGALVLGFACAGFVVSASAGDVVSNDAAKDITDVAAGGHAGHGHNPAAGIGSGGNPTGEGALLEGNCFGDMAVYNKEGKYVGRGIVNTCN